VPSVFGHLGGCLMFSLCSLLVEIMCKVHGYQDPYYFKLGLYDFNCVLILV
jgi:hypothetical protein